MEILYNSARKKIEKSFYLKFQINFKLGQTYIDSLVLDFILDSGDLQSAFVTVL